MSVYAEEDLSTRRYQASSLTQTLGHIGQHLPTGLSDRQVYLDAGRAVTGLDMSGVTAGAHAMSENLNKEFKDQLDLLVHDDPGNAQARDRTLGTLARVGLAMAGELMHLVMAQHELKHNEPGEVVITDDRYENEFRDRLGLGAAVGALDGDELGMQPIHSLMQSIGVMQVSINRESGESDQKILNPSDPDDLKQLNSQGFDAIDIAMQMVAEETPDSPFVFTFAPQNIDRKGWQTSGWDPAEYANRLIVMHVAHRVYGHLLVPVVAVMHEGKPAFRIQDTLYETPEQHADMKQTVLTRDPFRARGGEGMPDNLGEMLQGLFGEGQTNQQDSGERSASDMLRALADVLDGKSNKIEWDETFDDDEDEQVSAVTGAGRVAKA